MLCRIGFCALIFLCHGCIPPATVSQNNKWPRMEMVPPPAIALSDQQAAAESDSAFAVDLYGELRKSDGNFVFSPACLSTALAMAWAGASGVTADDMMMAMHIRLDPERLHAVNHNRLYEWNGGDGSKERSFELTATQSLWGQKGLAWEPEFLDLTDRRYASGFQDADFKSAQGGAAINTWVRRRSRGKVTDAVSSGAISRQTRLMLVNTAHFKGEWEHPFAVDRTVEAAFRAGGQRFKAPMMNQRQFFLYGEFEGLKIIELPYKKKAVSMIVIVPNAVDGLSDLENKLTCVEIDGWLKRLSNQQVDVCLPRFHFDLSLELSTDLASLGMPSAFDRLEAEFTGMCSTPELFIDHVVHKVKVQANELGSEADTPTSVQMASTSEQFKSSCRMAHVFRADRPFLFLIRDNRTGDLLFLGRVTDPRL